MGARSGPEVPSSPVGCGRATSPLGPVTGCQLSTLGRTGVPWHRPKGPPSGWADRTGFRAGLADWCGPGWLWCLAIDLTGPDSAPSPRLVAATVLRTITAVPLPTPPGRPILTGMTGPTVRHCGRLPISLLVASPLALLLVVLVASPALAASSLSNATVTPTHAYVGSNITFSVTFTDDQGRAPSLVSVQVDSGTRQTMNGAGSDYAHGVLYTFTGTGYAIGTHTVHFRATGDHDPVYYSMNFTVDTPTPTPTPKATPTPAPRTTPAPSNPVPTIGTTPAPTATPPGSVTGSGTNKNTGPTGTASPAPTTNPAASPSGGTGAAVLTTDNTGTADPIAWIGSANSYPGSLSGNQLTPSARGGGSGQGLPAAPYSARYPTLSQILMELAPTVAAASAGGAAWAAFAFFGKRRRDDEEIDEGMLATAAAAVYEVEAAPGLRVVDESLMPRWRRPSLQEVRRTDPLRSVVDTTRLSFDAAGIRPLANFERRLIGYRLVRLLDSPDEYRSMEIGILDQGDEVQLLERRGVYWLVLCPDGRQGWVHRMTLAEPVQPDIAPEPEPMPQYMDDETGPVTDPVAELGASDLLHAYLRARGEVA